MTEDPLERVAVTWLQAAAYAVHSRLALPPKLKSRQKILMRNQPLTHNTQAHIAIKIIALCHALPLLNKAKITQAPLKSYRSALEKLGNTQSDAWTK